MTGDAHFRQVDPSNPRLDEDWEGSNAAFTCPHCRKVFIVNATRMHNGVRACPKCGKSTGRCNGGKLGKGTTASLEWEPFE